MRASGVALGGLLLGVGAAGIANAQSSEAILTAAERRVPSYLATVEELVAIESGSGDIAGLEQMAALLAGRLRSLGGEVETIDVNAGAERFVDTPAELGPAVRARFFGAGSASILLIAHMDTVYERGMAAAQPFRIDGNRVYGLGIADDRHGMAMILHTVAVLQELGFDDFGTLTVLINGDEEISSPGSRGLITRVASEHDVVYSYEGSAGDSLRLATSGIGAITLRVTGRASHAGSAPEDGRNALYELAHQILAMRDLSRPEDGVKLNWTLAAAGSVRNAIPDRAEATADVRMLRVEDWFDIEREVRRRVEDRLIPDTIIDVRADFRRPPLEPTAASLALASRLAKVYGEIGRTLEISAEPTGGGTDAAFAGLGTGAAVIEGMGALRFGAHSNDAEYILLDSIAPRLFLSVRAIVVASHAAIGRD